MLYNWNGNADWDCCSLAEGITGVELINISTACSVIYCVWGIEQFFKGTFVSYVKALVSYTAGLFIFTFLAILVGILIELCLNKCYEKEK